MAKHPILQDLVKLMPSGFDGEQIEIWEPSDWRLDESDGIVSNIKRERGWNTVQFAQIGHSYYLDKVLVTIADPISPNGAIYLAGPDIAWPEGNDNWPAGLLRIALHAGEWVKRLQNIGDEPCISPGSINDELGDKADEYRNEIRMLNPGLDW